MGQRAALYCRVSTADQSCARQERDLLAFAARADYQVVGVFKETGSGVKLDRVERRKVMALAQARHIDVVVVTELSRWGRSTLDLLESLRDLEARRVSVIALSGMTFDLSSAVGRMMATVLAGIAEGPWQEARPAARTAAEIGSAGAQGAGIGRRRAQLSPDWPGTGSQQEHRGRHRETSARRKIQNKGLLYYAKREGDGL